MITPEGFGVAVTTGFTLVGLVFVYYYLLRQAEIDRFRDQAFQLRDQLFDLIVDEAIHTEDPAYTVLRRRMNGFIRYAHRLSIPAAIGFAVIIPEKMIRDDEWGIRMRELATENPELHRRLVSLSDEMSNAVLVHILLMSPALTLFGCPILLCGVIGWYCVARVRNTLEEMRQRIRYLAENVGTQGLSTA
ncbi:MAG TPA: hypothetical protein VGM20_11125 [Gemmatimonadales bacterium]